MEIVATTGVSQGAAHNIQLKPAKSGQADQSFDTVMAEDAATAEERTVDQLREAIEDIRSYELKLSDQLKELEKRIEATQAALKFATGAQADALTRQLDALQNLKEQLMKELVLAQTQQGETSDDKGGGSEGDLTQEALLTVFDLRSEEMRHKTQESKLQDTLKAPDLWRSKEDAQG